MTINANPDIFFAHGVAYNRVHVKHTKNRLRKPDVAIFSKTAKMSRCSEHLSWRFFKAKLCKFDDPGIPHQQYRYRCDRDDCPDRLRRTAAAVSRYVGCHARA